jgi:phenol 2-monooxygenase (NADPH)
MQYHQNGFNPGDPDIAPAVRARREANDPLPTKVDVLIAGSGPAGLCLAAQLARIPTIHTMLVEPKLGPMEKGQADGINVRSMEMFQAFGFGEKVARESVWINETTFWAPADAEQGETSEAPLTRVARVQDVPDDISEMPHVLINQARVHDMFLDIMRHSPNRLSPDYGWKVTEQPSIRSQCSWNPPALGQKGKHTACAPTMWWDVMARAPMYAKRLGVHSMATPLTRHGA